MTGFSATLASLLDVMTKLHGMQPPASPGSIQVGPRFTSLGPQLLSAITDLQADDPTTAANVAHITPAAIAVLDDALSTTPSATAPAGLPLWTLMLAMAAKGLLVAEAVAAKNLVDSLNSNSCIPSVQALFDFQTAYQMNHVNFIVSGVYDAATATALGDALGVAPPVCATPVNPGPLLPPLPPPLPIPTPSPTPKPPTQASNTGAVVAAVAVVGILGWRKRSKHGYLSRSVERYTGFDCAEVFG